MKVGGTVRVPGDKSITHRAFMFASLTQGASTVSGALTSLDARTTARILRQLGADVSPVREGTTVTITGRRQYRRPVSTLDCGNSGTTTRLMLGLLAAHSFEVTLTGDRSLRRRPMRRVTGPLSQMGAHFTEKRGDGLPLVVRGDRLRRLEYELPVTSAQIKSSLLLAGVAGAVDVSIREPQGRSRDHTERMLRAFGYSVAERDGWIDFRPTGRIEPLAMRVPGDPSSAAFLIGAALLAQGGQLRIEDVGINPTRTGFLEVLRRMGGKVTVENAAVRFGEPVADLVTGPALLSATEIVPGEVPGLIDEIPLLAVLAARAAGTTRFRDVGELRVKESDRLGLVADNLRAVGVDAEVQGDDLFVTGTDAPPKGRVRTAGDHRMAMAFAVLDTVPDAAITIDDLACAAVSFPRFPETLHSIRSR